ncbi:hypothetical protein CR513_56773, partial [Mucuna pruriens]
MAEIPPRPSRPITFSRTIFEKLDDKNILLWHQQEPVIKGHCLQHFVVCRNIPLCFLNESDLQSSLSSLILLRVLGSVHSYQLWEKIHDFFKKKLINSNPSPLKRLKHSLCMKCVLKNFARNSFMNLPLLISLKPHLQIPLCSNSLLLWLHNFISLKILKAKLKALGFTILVVVAMIDLFLFSLNLSERLTPLRLKLSQPPKRLLLRFFLMINSTKHMHKRPHNFKGVNNIIPKSRHKNGVRYSRMPPNLLPIVVTTIRTRIEEGFWLKSDRSSLLAAAIGCLTLALSTSPSSAQIRKMLCDEVSSASSSVAISHIDNSTICISHSSPFGPWVLDSIASNYLTHSTTFANKSKLRATKYGFRPNSTLQNQLVRSKLEEIEENATLSHNWSHLNVSCVNLGSLVELPFLVICPHITQPNGVAERKHRHNVNTALTLLLNVSAASKFWGDAVLMSPCAINCIFLGYLCSKGILLILTHLCCFYTSVDVTFFEDTSNFTSSDIIFCLAQSDSLFHIISLGPSLYCSLCFWLYLFRWSRHATAPTNEPSYLDPASLFYLVVDPRAFSDLSIDLHKDRLFTCNPHSMYNFLFLSYDYLSPTYFAFASAISSVSIPK